MNRLGGRTSISAGSETAAGIPTMRYVTLPRVISAQRLSAFLSRDLVAGHVGDQLVEVLSVIPPSLAFVILSSALSETLRSVAATSSWLLP